MRYDGTDKVDADLHGWSFALAGNELGAEGAKAIAPALANMQSLITLDLSSTNAAEQCDDVMMTLICIGGVCVGSEWAGR
jgi:Ran GTPase-activating protein (RanGAP) involved in mRNA processing and transport